MFEPWIAAPSALATAVCAGAGIATHRMRIARNAAQRSAAGWEAEAARKKAEAEEKADQLREATTRADTAVAWLEAIREETKHLAKWRVPALVDAVARKRPGVVQPGLHYEQFAGDLIGESHQNILDQLSAAMDAAQERIAGNAGMALRNLAEVPHTVLVNAQFAVLAEMEAHEDAPQAVIDSLRRIDGLLNIALRAVQRLRIVTGSWPGFQRATSSLGEIIDGAKARVHGSKRINYAIHEESDKILISSLYVEAIATALAELLDNALKSSTDFVTVHIVQGGRFFTIVVEDAGIGMAEDKLAHANATLRRDSVLDVTELDDSLKMGFAVVARLVHDYKLGAQIDQSATFGGMRATLRIPLDYRGEDESQNDGGEPLTHFDAAYGELDIARADAPLAAAGFSSVAPSPSSAGQQPTTSGGLPKRTQHFRTSKPAPPTTAVAQPAVPLDYAEGLSNIGQAIANAGPHTATDDAEETP